MVYVEQVDHRPGPPANRSNDWRYMGPRGVAYRRQAVFGSAFVSRSVADAWQDSQVDLLARDRLRLGLRGVDVLTGAFIVLHNVGRLKKGLMRAAPNALLTVGNYFRNICSILLKRGEMFLQRKSKLS